MARPSDNWRTSAWEKTSSLSPLSLTAIVDEEHR